MLDWSTLPLFYQLHEAGLLTLPASLWVAAQVLEFLRELIAEKERQPVSRMSLIISERSVRPVQYAENYHADELAFLHKLLAWVEINCQTRLVTEKLDLLRESKRNEASWLTDDEYGFFMGAIDTQFLVEKPGSVLISDDLVITDLARHNRALVSSEKYLRTFAADFNTAILPVLLQYRYVGLAFDPEMLFNLFMGAGGTFTGLAYRYLQSLPLAVQADIRALLAVHTFLRNLYLVRSLSPEQISAHAVTVYVHALRHVKLVPQVQGMIQNWIARIFNLLPLHKASIKRDFATAWKQLTASCLLLPD
ncbi:MAG: PIN domain-containing protein [Janthinobacterium lividum]